MFDFSEMAGFDKLQKFGEAEMLQKHGIPAGIVGLTTAFAVSTLTKDATNREINDMIDDVVTGFATTIFRNVNIVDGTLGNTLAMGVPVVGKIGNRIADLIIPADDQPASIATNYVALATIGVISALAAYSYGVFNDDGAPPASVGSLFNPRGI